jgi:broad specificity phosphatase PhoE
MWIYLVRHAQSEANAGVSGAPIDCELTALGRRQAEATGEWLTRARLDLILCSPYIRALDTASAISRATGAPLEVFPPIHEHHIEAFGETWPLLGRQALLARFPHVSVPDDFVDANWHQPPETDAATLLRMGRALEIVRARFSADPEPASKRVCLVSHGSPTGKMVMAFQGITTIAADVRIENASISVLHDTPQGRSVSGVNWVEHLPERTW